MTIRFRWNVGFGARIAAAVAVGMLSCAAVHAAPAHGGTYHLLECHDWGNSWAVDDSTSWGPGNVNIRNDCQNSSAVRRLFGVESNQGNPGGVVGIYRTHAPGGLGIIAARAHVKLRRGKGLRAQFGYWISGDFHPLYTTDPADAKWVSLPWYDVPNGWSVGVRLICTNPTCPKPPRPATAFMSHVELKIYDKYKPMISTFAGSLVERDGWLRGTQTLKVQGYDVGSGLILVRVDINDQNLFRQRIECRTAASTWPFVTRGTPCFERSELFAFNVGTQENGFADGCRNTVKAVTQEYTGSWSNAAVEQVCIDNAPPKLAFRDHQLPADPELIRVVASDEHSGLRSDSATISIREVGSDKWRPLMTAQKEGSAEARVDSAAYRPGEYEFRATIVDIAGNETTTTKRVDGSPMRLTFPLRPSTELSAHLEPSGAVVQTVGYRRPAFVAGQLEDADGQPLPDQKVTVVEHFGDGALIRERVTNVRTNAEGRWDTRLPAGPSRTVTATYAGTRRYRGDDTRAGSLKVKSGATLKPSRRRIREGNAVMFRGKIGRKGARIPVGGKLVELQVKVAKRRWDTVKRPFYTGSGGRWRLRYRFGRFYTRNVRYQFRIHVPRESDWPYRSARSRKRQVVVMAG